ncbi:MAG TPA: DUF2946 family protein [Pseudorhodoferax sp.]|nr:DUF2946 family protein [Pseudorhodoferax sp.]
MARLGTLLHSRRKHCAWLMLAVLLWACLLPQLARLANAPPAPWMDVCTGMGPLVVQVAADVSADAHDDAGQTVKPGACPFCRLHAADGAPPAAWRCVHPARTRADPPASPPAQPTPSRPWRVDLARAPPSATQA